MRQTAPTVVDLFSGCGGISWGLRRAGFRIHAGVDHDEAALKSFSKNFPDALSPLLDLGDEETTKSLPSILQIEPGELDLLVGGPPCQGFSKNVPRRGRFLEDPKNLLVRAFMQAVDVLRPKAVLMENVAEMANAFEGQFRDELFAFFDRLGYRADYQLHNAAEYGVPQRRRRVVFLANRLGQPIRFPDPIATVPTGKGTDLNVKGAPGLVSVWDAIGDLAPVRGSSATPNCYASGPFSEFQRKMRSQNAPLTDHVERRLRPQQQARYDSLKPGQGLPDLPPTLRPRSGYSGAYGRLTLHMLSPTITRWVFHPGSGRFGHPVESRIITIREAARLQSFSDDFAFVGTNQQKSWQIGNAVPPLLAEACGQALLDVLGCAAGTGSGSKARRKPVQLTWI